MTRPGRRPRSAAEREGERAAALLERSLQTGNGVMLERAVALLRSAMAKASASDPYRPTCLANLGVALQTRFRRTGNMADLDEAIQFMTAALRASQASGSDSATDLSNLGYSLRLRFERSGDMADLTEAISLGRAAVAAAPNDPERFYYLDSLAGSLNALFERTEQLAAIDEAIALVRAAVAATPSGHPERPRYLANANAALHARFRRTGKIADIDGAIEAGRAALQAAPRHDAELPRYMANLGAALLDRYKVTREPADIDEAIDLLQQAVRAVPEGHPDRASYQSRLGNARRTRFDWTADPQDATAAIEALRSAVAAVPIGSTERASCLSNLAVALHSGFFKTGQPEYLNEEIDAHRAAAAAYPSGHPEHRRILVNLGNGLRVRAARFRDPADQAEAVSLLSSAARNTPPDHPDYPGTLFNLASAHLLGFEHVALGQHLPGAPMPELNDLTAAIDALRDALGATPAGHPDRARIATELSKALRARGVYTGEVAFLNDAVEAGRVAVASAPAGHPDHADALDVLAGALLARAELAEDHAALTEAIEVIRSTVALLRVPDPGAAVVYSRLGAALETRFRWTGDPEALAGALDAFGIASGAQAGQLETRLFAALERGQLAAENGLTDEAEAGYAAAVDMLPLVAWPGLGQRAKLEYLARLAGIAGDAAACAITAGHLERAVELLDNGRSILWSQALGLRGDLDDLRAAHPALASQLDGLRAVLDRRADDMTDRDQLIRSGVEYDGLVERIRALPGFGSFLTAPSFAELIPSADDSPVVIVNVSRYRCDALAVTSGGVRLIPLPELSVEAAEENARRFLRALNAEGSDDPDTAVNDVLSWLGDAVTGPVLDALSYSASPEEDLRSWPRVWWCPVWSLTALPLHAAGRRGNAVMDRVVSSYTPTLRALQRARAAQPPAVQPRVLLVAMPTTPYLPAGAPLVNVQKEIAVVSGRFAGKNTLRLAEAATGATVLADLARHPFVHFSCHGAVLPDKPEDSGLYLADGRLTIEELSHHRLPAETAQFAFLSACETAASTAALADEAITMAAAMQLAGFRHVIATLWPIADFTAPDVVSEVYRVLLADHAADTDLPAAQALHSGVRLLRDQGFPPVLWAPYIHNGP
jgi:hypothetical protein